jgi:putative nucleotidyltransferase with HDIG domain
MGREYKKYRMAKVLLEVSSAVSASLDLDTVSGLILRESTEALGADHASLFLTDESSGRPGLRKARGFSEDEIDNIKLLGSWEVINHQLMAGKRSLIVNDVETDPIFRKKRLPFSREKIPVKSFLAVPLKKGREIVGSLIASNRRRPGHLFTKEDEELLIGLSNHIAIALLNAKLYQNLKNLFISTVISLARAVDAKDPYTSGHSERVTEYALAIGREMRLDDPFLENLRLSSLLHDVGKIGIRDNVLTKPGKLSRQEKDLMDRHPAIGARIVDTVDNSHKIIRGIREHHERFDGAGYPGRLKGRRISLEGRIIAVADTFDALTTNRPYRKSYTPKEAFFEIKRETSAQFDPKVVDAFIRSFSKHPEIWKV